MPAKKGIAYDVSGVEAGGDFVPAKKGLYTAEVVGCEDRAKDGKKDLQVVVKLIKDSKGKKVNAKDHANPGVKAAKGQTIGNIFGYVNYENETARWKLKEFLVAVGLDKDKGTLVPSKIEGEKIRVRVTEDSYDGEPTARVGRYLPLGEEEAKDDDDDDDDDEDEDEEEAKDDDDDDEEEDEDEEEEEDEDDEDDDPLAELSRAALKKHIKENDIDVKVTKKMSDDDLREAIKGAGSDEEEEEGDDESDDYDEWSSDELREELKKRELESKGKSKAVLIKRLRKDDEDEPF